MDSQGEITTHFPHFMNYNIICHNCNNYGNITKFCRSDFRKNQKEESLTFMERNQEKREQNKENLLFIQTAAHA
jgi:hypothetical protein